MSRLALSQLFVLRELMKHGADWHQCDTSAVGDQITPIVHAELYYSSLYHALELNQLAGPRTAGPRPRNYAPSYLFNSVNLQKLFIGVLFFHGLVQCELQLQSECDVTEQGGRSASQ